MINRKQCVNMYQGFKVDISIFLEFHVIEESTIFVPTKYFLLH